MTVPILNMIGRTFGMLTVSGGPVHKEGRDELSWECKCKCGTLGYVTTGYALRRGGKEDCGCVYDPTGENSPRFKHGLSRTPEGRIYRGMAARCKNDARPEMRVYYADRGIRVCRRWSGKNGIVNFVTDMGSKPTPRHMLERRNNDRGYSPGNCYWATPKQQARNRRSNRLLTFNNQTMCLTDWAKAKGWNPMTLWTRIQTYGWTVERALTQEVKLKRKRAA